MKQVYSFSNTSLFFIILSILLGIPTVWGNSLESGFRNPPRKYSMVPLWSLNGRLDREQLCWQIDQMVDKGVYGAFMHARAGIDLDKTPYFSEGWWRGIRACVKHGAKVGFRPWIYDEDKWPSGSAGGRTIRNNPTRNRAKDLRRTEWSVQGPKAIDISIPGARYIIAGRRRGDHQLDPDSLVDVTRFNTSNTPWPCPEGEWRLFAYVYEMREGVNYLNKNTVRDFIDITHEEYAKRFGNYFGDTVPGVFFDEIQNEAGKDASCVVWVEGFAKRFREMKGYDLPPVLPALSMDIGRRTPKVRCDYYDVYTTLYEQAWFKQLADWCEAHHLKLTGHTIEELNRYTTEGNYIRTLRHLQIPTTDNEDFRYTWPRTIHPWKPKQLASISHLYGHPRSGVEAMGGAGWSFTLNSARYGFNMLSVYGINFFIPHLFHYAQDRPQNVDDWPNSWFFRNPYWKYFKTFADHGRRLSFMLTGGTNIVDVAVLYPQTNCWAGYGSGTTHDTISQLVAAQIDADLLDPESLIRAEIKNRSLIVGDMRYQIVVLPGIQCIRLTEAQKLREFIEAGGRVIVHNRWPTDSMEHGKDDPELLAFQQYAEKQGVQSISPTETVQEISRLIPRDLIITQGMAQGLRYRHVRRCGKEVYWLVNSERKKGEWKLSFRAVGAPSLWQPEDGLITPITAFLRRGERTVIHIELDGWQGCFVVFDRTHIPDRGGVEIESTNLLEPGIHYTNNNTIEFSGWLPPGERRAEVRAALYNNHARTDLHAARQMTIDLESLNLNQSWEFIPVGAQLDYEWRATVRSADLSLPVMRVRWERNSGEPVNGWQMPTYDDRRWRRVKILDALHATDGADRFRSRWEARFISYYPYTPFDLDRFFQPKIGGAGLRCSKRFILPPEVTQAQIAVLCESAFQVYINDRQCASGKGGNSPECLELYGLRPGESTLTIVADNSRVILAEGAFLTEYGSPMPIYTDNTWKVSLDGNHWAQAWEYVAPPERPYGEPAHPWETERPTVVWYRAFFPPGVTTIDRPTIEGKWQAWVDGLPVVFRKNQYKLKSTGALLAIRVSLSGKEHGLMKPIQLRCHPAKRPLGSWTKEHLDWYSGRAIYTTTFRLSKTYKNENICLTLDLGKVCYCAEVWLNHKLVGTRVWPPYRLDITDYSKVGQNKLSVVVANLIANRMRWDIFDDAKSVLAQRKWHDSSILRDGWCLQSGLLGPVRIIPLRKARLITKTTN